jgi:hypothetical protein
MALIPVATFLSRIEARLGQGYCYGMYFKDPVTQNAIDAKTAQFPTQYNTSITYGGVTKLAKIWAQDWIGEYAGDCSGMIKAAYWTNDDGDVVYKYLGRADTSANGLYNMATNKGPISTMPDTPGLGLHKNGHTGVYIGDGHVIEARGVAYGVVQTDLEIGVSNVRNWLGWYEVPYVDYTEVGGGGTEPPVVPDIYNYNLLDEGLELGPMVPNDAPLRVSLDEMAIIVLSNLTDELVPAWGQMYGGLFGEYWMYGSTDADAVSSYLDGLGSGHAGAIIAIFMAPNMFAGCTDVLSLIPASPNPPAFDFTSFPRPGSLDGYTPKNRKLLYYPYQYLYVHNGDGGRMIYKFEEFNGTPAFTIIAALVPGGTCKLYPTNILHGGDSEMADVDMSLTLAAFPTCLWNINEYQNWIGVHGVSQTINTVGSIGGAAAGIIAGAMAGPAAPAVIAGAVGAGVFGVAQTLAKNSEAEKMPPSQQGGFSSQYALATNGENKYTLYPRSIKYMQAKRLDDYFEMYGYKTLELKIPDLRSRQYWNYIKTINISIQGQMPEADRLRLCNIFDNGVTIWHDAYHFGDYSQNNH